MRACERRRDTAQGVVKLARSPQLPRVTSRALARNVLRLVRLRQVRRVHHHPPEVPIDASFSILGAALTTGTVRGFDVEASFWLTSCVLRKCRASGADRVTVWSRKTSDTHRLHGARKARKNVAVLIRLNDWLHAAPTIDGLSEITSPPQLRPDCRFAPLQGWLHELGDAICRAEVCCYASARS